MTPGPNKPRNLSGLPSARPDTCRGKIIKVHMAADGRTPLFRFDVMVEGGGKTTGGLSGVLQSIPMKQAGFHNPLRANPSPSGIIHLPEEGAIVDVKYDGRTWIIDGFYTGPVITTAESVTDAEGLVVSYNPGIECAAPRVAGEAAFTVPSWAFGISPGDSLIGCGDSRVKVTNYGATIGAGPDAFVMYKADGEVLSKFQTENVRGLGYWRRLHSHIGLHDVLTATAAKAISDEVPVPQVAYTYLCEIVESSPTYLSVKPYSIRQRGHISPTILDDGRISVNSSPTGQTVALESATGQFIVMRDAVVVPKSPLVLPGFTSEMSTTSHIAYDHQVMADGSFAIRAGNQVKAPGVTTPKHLSQLDFDLSFDAATHTFHLRAGLHGGQLSVITLNGATGELTANASAKAVVQCANGATSVTLTPALVRVSAPILKLDCPIIDASSSAMKVASLLTAGSDYTTHKHIYTDAFPVGPGITLPPT